MKIRFAKCILNVISSLPVLIGGIVVNIIIRYPGNNIIDLHQFLGRDECIGFTTVYFIYSYTFKCKIGGFL